MKVTIYGRPNCKFCDQSIQLCENKGLEFDYYTVKEHISIEELTEKAKRLDVEPEKGDIVIRTVPQIFITENDQERYVRGGFEGLKEQLNQ